MLHEPERYVFAVFDVPPGEKAYGLEGNGVVLFWAGERGICWL